jgi:hypothetical protein
LALIICCLFGLTVKGQETKPLNNSGCAQVELVEQKKLLRANRKPPRDVIVIDPDNIAVTFQLKNNCGKTIYYLVSVHTQRPVGFMLFKPENGKWKARSPGWGREGIFTDDDNYSWLPVESEKSMKFEFTDISLIEGERSVAIYVNDAPKQENRIEINAEPYLPLKIERENNGY